MQFPYVDAVLKEALRMEPPAGFGTMRQLREVRASLRLPLVLGRISHVCRRAMSPFGAWVGGVL